MEDGLIKREVIHQDGMRLTEHRQHGIREKLKIIIILKVCILLWRCVIIEKKNYYNLCSNHMYFDIWNLFIKRRKHENKIQ